LNGLSGRCTLEVFEHMFEHMTGSRARSEAVTVGDLDPALPWTAVREDAARGSAALPGSSIGAVVEQAVNHEGGRS
jgi:hypothetical protein